MPPGPLARALILLGRQGGVTIVTGDPTAASVVVPGIRGRWDVATALHTLLRGSGFQAIRSDAATFIVRRQQPPHRAAALAPPTTPASPVTGPDIIVTATKQHQPLHAIAATVHVVDLDSPELRNVEAEGTEALIATLPVLSSTGLGPGRDKIFIRGIADSSFSGPTQATVGQYFGDVRLNYNAPDPDLPLYDIASVEVLEGPQATLYGAGSLGGIVRTVPRRPRVGGWEASVTTSLSLAANGQAGYELAGMLNVPLTSDIAARFVGYNSTVPGVIDDTQRGLHAVDRMRTAGARGTIAAQLNDGWSIEGSGIFQQIDHADARYAEGDPRTLTRASAIAQPAAIDFTLGAMTLRKRKANGLEFVGVLSGIADDSSARYDLSMISPGLSAAHRSVARILSGEARLSRSHDDGTGWLLGVHAVHSVDQSVDRIATDAVDQRSTTIHTRVLDGAIFGEATFAIAHRLTATIGTRVSSADAGGDGRIVSDAMAPAGIGLVAAPGGATVRVLPTAALAWQPTLAITAYARYQRGYRVGGPSLRANESVGADQPVFAIAAFKPDAIDMVEAGIRFGQTRSSMSKGGISVSASQWQNIQADLFDTIGAYTANMGDGRIVSLEANGRWQAAKGLELGFAFFTARTRLVQSGSGVGANVGERLPNISDFTARIDLTKRFVLGDWQASTRGGIRYVGISRLGTGRDFLLRQGGYVDANAGAEISRAERTLFVELTNILGVEGNRFAFGNPYTAADGDQRTPLRPRTIRIGMRTKF